MHKLLSEREDSKSKVRNVNVMIKPCRRPSPLSGSSAHFFTGASEAFFLWTYLFSLCSLWSNPHWVFLVLGMHQVLIFRSKAKEKSGPETFILYPLLTYPVHLAQSSSFSGFRPLPPRVSLPPFAHIRLFLLSSLPSHIPQCLLTIKLSLDWKLCAYPVLRSLSRTW